MLSAHEHWLLLWEMAKGRSMSLCPTLVTGRTSALGKVLFLDCQLGWNMPEETPRACIPFLLPSLPLSPGNIPDPVTDSWRVLSSIGGATLKKEAGRGDPTTRRHGAYMAF